MAFKDLGAVADEDQIRVASPLQPQGEEPIAALLGKIPGIGPFLKQVQQQTSPKGVMGPGILAQLGAAATGATPQGVYDATIGPTRAAAGMAAGLALPGPTLLARLLGGAVIPMVEHAIEQPGQDPVGFVGKGLLGAGLQGAAEGLGGAIKQIPMQRAASRARNAFTRETEEAESRIAIDLAGERRQAAEDLKAFRKERESIRGENATGAAENARQVQDIRNADAARIRGEKADYRTAKQRTLAEHETRVKAADAELIAARGMHAEELAKVTMDEAKQAIPAWRDIPSSVPGIYTAVLGKGQDLLSKEYGQAMAKALETARGKDLLLPLEDIRRLKIVAKGFGNHPDMAPGEGITHGVVDAADAIEAITKAKNARTDWGLYRRTVEALGDLGIAPEARDAYKTGQGIIEAIDKSGALHPQQGQSILDTEKLFEAMHKVQGINTLRNRGMGDWDTSPIVRASKAPPQPGPEIPSPDIAPFVPSGKTATPVFEAKPLPEKPVREPFTPEELPLGPDESGAILGPKLGTRGQRMTAGGSLGMLGGLLTGVGGGYYHSPPALAGILAGLATPNQWITKAPGTEPLIQLLQKLQTFGASDLREAIQSPLRAPEEGKEGTYVEATAE